MEKIEKAVEKTASTLASVAKATVLIAVLSILGIADDAAYAAADVAAINEVMYDPIGDDNNREYIEVYLDGPISLEGWIIADSESNDTLQAVHFSASGFALIVEQGYNYTGCNCSVYSVGSTIGNNLNNDEDFIILYDANGTMIDEVGYSGPSNGSSLEMCADGWRFSATIGGSPGITNPCINNSQDKTQDGSEDPDEDPDEGPENAGEEGDETEGSSEIDESGSQDGTCPCNITLKIEAEKLLYEDGEQVKYSIVVSDKSYPFVLEYWIEDLFGNTVKTRYNTTNTNSKTWTPHIDSQVEGFKIKARIVSINCTLENSPGNETHAEALVAETLIIVKGEAPLQDSWISILEEGTAKFGSTLNARVEMHKGDTQKSTVYAYVTDSHGEKISDTTKVNIYPKYMTSEFSLPIRIKPNCDGKYEDGYYKLIVEGLDADDSGTVMISGKTASACGTGDCPACDKPEYEDEDSQTPSAHIRSFYTLSKKYNQKINLFAGLADIDEDVDEGIYAVLETGYGTEVQRVDHTLANSSSVKLSFSVEVVEARNLFVLRLVEGNTTRNTTLDEAYLIVDFSNPEDGADDNGTYKADAADGADINDDDKSPDGYKEYQDGRIFAGSDKSMNSDVRSDVPTITGAVTATKNIDAKEGIENTGNTTSGYSDSIYEADKSKRLILPIFVVLLCILGLIFVFKKN